VEEYGLGRLAASADAVLAGLGPLAVALAGLAGEAGRAVTLDAMEVLVIERGRELLREVVQLSLDAQAAGEVRVARVAGADGVTRGRAERGHARTVVTAVGAVRVRRIAYRSGVRGVPSLFPRDAVLDLLRAFRTADFGLIHAADCRSTYSSWTCCGVRYWSPECRRLELYQNSMYRTTSRRAWSRVGYWVR
jgi:hypothetical protein